MNLAALRQAIQNRIPQGGAMTHAVAAPSGAPLGSAMGAPQPQAMPSPMGGGMAGGGGGMDPHAQAVSHAMQFSPEAAMELHKSKIKDDLKRMRIGEVHQEVGHVIRSRMNDINKEQESLFKSKYK
jgi:hypothetical protein